MPAGAHLPIIAITAGEPAGVGPELAARLATENWPAHLVIVADRTLIESRAQLTGHRLALSDFSPPNATSPGASLLHIPLDAVSTAGKLDAANSRYVLATLQAAVDGCVNRRFHAMVT